MSELPNAGLLSLLDDEMRNQLFGYGSVLNTLPDQVIIPQGKSHKQLYLVVDGKFRVSTQGPMSTVELEEVGIGDCFGEVALFNPGEATASVNSVGHGRLWFTDLVMFQLFLYECDVAGCALLVGINTLLSRRLKRANQIIKNNQILPSFLSVRNRHRTSAIPNMAPVPSDTK